MFKVPEGTRVYAIGDIHGASHLLDMLHEKIHMHAKENPIGRKVLITLGDYIDRGPSAKGVMDRILNVRLDGFEHITLRGNHEEFPLNFIANSLTLQSWIPNGGASTLWSYGLDKDKYISQKYNEEGQGYYDVDYKQLHADFLGVIPESHVRFMAEAPTYHIEGDYFFCHAGVDTTRSAQDQLEYDLTWAYHGWRGTNRPWTHCVVHGHIESRDRKPDIRKYRIGIDTGAWHTGVLTALILEGDSISYINTEI